MSIAIAHFAFGAAATTLVVTVVLPSVTYPRTVVLLGGGWAMLPDLHWVSPVATEQLHRMHRTSVWADLFWFHRTLDRLDPADSKALAAVFVGCFLAATVLAERRSYRTPAPIAAMYESRLGDTEDKSED